LPESNVEPLLSFVEFLGRGGFSTVYLVDVHRGSGFVQRLAVKILNEDVQDDPDVTARQRDEARLLAQLNHDHIVKVIDLFRFQGRPAVLMEYIDGVDAAMVAAHTTLPPRAALEIAGAVASALDRAYNTVSSVTGRPLRLIHRDIKPANVLLSGQGGVKVLDFGVAQADFDREGQTRSMQFGTVRFMAPEQLIDGQLSAAVDVYALGVSLLDLLGSRAFRERPPLSAEKFGPFVAAALADLGDPTWPAPWRSELTALLQRMLARDPTDRPTAAAVRQTCLELLPGAPGESLTLFAQRWIPRLVERRQEAYASRPTPILASPSAQVSTSAMINPIATVSPTAMASPELPTDSLRLPNTEQRLPLLWILVAGLIAVLGLGVVALGASLALTTLALQDRPAATPAPASPAAPTSAGVPAEPPEPPVAGLSAQAEPTEPATSADATEGADGAGLEPAAPPEPPPAIAPPRPSPASTLYVSSRPYSTLTLDGQDRGSTHWSGTLSAGTHTLRLRTADGREVTHRLNLSAGGEERLCWDFDLEAMCPP